MFIHLIIWWQLRIETFRISDHIITPRMDLNAPDLPETFALFPQQMKLYSECETLNRQATRYSTSHSSTGVGNPFDSESHESKIFINIFQ